MGDPRNSFTLQPFRQESGVAILITVIVMLVVSLLGATVVTLGRIDYTISAHYRSSTSARHLADSALEATFADFRSDFLADPNSNWSKDWINSGASPPAAFNPFPDVEGTSINGAVLTELTLDPNPYPGTPYALGDPVSLGDGSYSRIIWLPPAVSRAESGATQAAIRTRAVGSAGGPGADASTVVDAVISLEFGADSPYENAAVFGTGVSGKLLEGGDIRIAGPILVLGDEHTKLQFNGSSQVNHYGGIDDPITGFGPLASKIPIPETTEVNGETVSTLNATFRLRGGQVILGGHGALGEPDSGGNSVKETLDGVFADGSFNPSHNIHADTMAPYDLDPSVTLPTLGSPFTDPETGVEYATYAAWLDAHSYTPLIGGDLVVDENTDDFSYTDPLGMGRISWDEDSGILTVDGIVKIEGQVKFGETGNPQDLAALRYRGTGVIYAADKIEIHKDLYPAGQFLSDGPDADSEIDGNLGLITAKEIQIVSGEDDPNVKIMATLYAEAKVEIQEPANIAGSLISPSIDAGGAGLVRLWHVPNLEGLFPAGMPSGPTGSEIAGTIRDWYESKK